MYFTVIAFLIGVVALQGFSHLPGFLWLYSIMLALGLLCYFVSEPFKKMIKWLLIAAAGLLWAAIFAHFVLSWTLSSAIENKPVVVIGVVSSLPKNEGDAFHFQFTTSSINHQLQKTVLQLAWYGAQTVPLRVGDQWQLLVKLKRPHGLMNPGGFDYDKWLFSHEIRATGYVINSPQTVFIQSKNRSHLIDRIRENLQIKIKQTLNGQPTAGLIEALVTGSQNDITPEQWKTMQATGTNHLMAIAGLHIGFMSGFSFILMNLLWRRSGRLCLMVPAQQAATGAALISAIVYSGLAGFSLPTQRALIMLTVFLLGSLLRRQFSTWNAYLLALLFIVLWEPLSTMTISFWLSFAAVFLIIYGVSGRLKMHGIAWHWGRAQWVIAIGLIPFCVWLFEQASFVSLIANFIAVPAVGFIVLPLCAIGTILLLVFNLPGHWVLLIAAKAMIIIWWVLTWLAHFKNAIWLQVMPNNLVLSLSVIGVLLLLAPKGLPGKWLGIIFFLPLIFYPYPKPCAGEVWFTVLDVGQGLATVVQTKNHVLIYDTGPNVGGFDAGQRVDLPFLYSQGIRKVDLMMISHGDNDHIGGAFTIIKNISVKQVFTSVPQNLLKFHAKKCVAGQSWQWDGVKFTVLYPKATMPYQDNNSSCILRINNQHESILLTGDIEKSAEKNLIQNNAGQLSSTVLVAPHHGSVTSSSSAFIKAVQAKYVIFSTGYFNRYHFPSHMVIKRYQAAHTLMLNTATSGAIQFKLGNTDPFISLTEQHKEAKAFWHEE